MPFSRAYTEDITDTHPLARCVETSTHSRSDIFDVPTPNFGLSPSAFPLELRDPTSTWTDYESAMTPASERETASSDGENMDVDDTSQRLTLRSSTTSETLSNDGHLGIPDCRVRRDDEPGPTDGSLAVEHPPNSPDSFPGSPLTPIQSSDEDTEIRDNVLSMFDAFVLNTHSDKFL